MKINSSKRVKNMLFNLTGSFAWVTILSMFCKFLVFYFQLPDEAVSKVLG